MQMKIMSDENVRLYTTHFFSFFDFAVEFGLEIIGTASILDPLCAISGFSSCTAFYYKVQGLIFDVQCGRETARTKQTTGANRDAVNRIFS